MTEQQTLTSAPKADQDRGAAAASWLQGEFPEWTIHVDETADWGGQTRPLWIAQRDGHHPQSELTAAKLHSRLSDYEHREARRQALAN